MNIKKSIALSILLVLTIIVSCSQTTTRNSSSSTKAIKTPLSGETKTVEMKLSKEISPSRISVKRGDRVVVSLSSNVSPCIGGNAGVAIRDFDVESEFTPGQVTTIEFIADKKGTFPIRGSRNASCTLCHQSLKGELIVE